MEAAGKPPKSVGIKIAALVIIVVGIGVGIFAAIRSSALPSSDEASIDAEVVHVATTVGGRIEALEVRENGHVKAGDVLFTIEPTAYQLAVDQARANVNLAMASAGTQGRLIATQNSDVAIARESVRRAETNLEQAQRTANRLRPLADANHVPRQQYDTAATVAADAAITLKEARIRAAASERAVGTGDGGQATIEASRAALAIAEHALSNTIVRAPHSGRIAGLKVRSGETVAPFQSLFTLITDEEWFAVANFREGQLEGLAEGDCVTAYSMVDRAVPMKGHIESIGAGVMSGDRIDLPRSVPYIQRTLEWVRVAQRFPVRIKLEAPPDRLMRLGASAVVQVRHGAACR